VLGCPVRLRQDIASSQAVEFLLVVIDVVICGHPTLHSRPHGGCALSEELLAYNVNKENLVKGILLKQLQI